MDRSCRQSSVDSSFSSSGSSYNNQNQNHNSRDQYLKNLNKHSQKISKPINPKKPPAAFDQSNFNHPPAPPPTQPQQQPQNQNQPLVYNINKNDFRDVVQKLTGSPAHERFSTPPPVPPPKPQVSRLQRIRPPPLANVSNRPPPIPQAAMPPAPPPQQQPPPPLNPALNPIPAGAPPANSFIQRPPGPLSTLSSFSGAVPVAESPVSAYMRYLQNSISNVDPNKQFSGFSPLAPLVSPRWNNNLPPQQPLQQEQRQFVPPPQQGLLPSPNAAGMMAPQPPFQLPMSPLPFGFLNSPRSPYPLLSPNLLLSPSPFPLSPTMPIHSPRWLLSPSSFPLSPTMPIPSPRWRGM